jgi:hypothetical protein
LGEYAVGDERVKVDIEVEGGAEPLDEGDGSRSATRDSLASSASALQGEDGAEEDLEDRAQQRWTIREPQTDLPRKR